MTPPTSDQMGQLLSRDLKYATLRDWIMPRFSTTTPLDATPASTIMMATLKAYLKYVFELRCGIPRVTLLGTREDWVALRERLERLDKSGTEPTKWAALSLPVCDTFTACFDAYGDATVQASCVDFYISTWLSSRICVWRDDGTWQGGIGAIHHIASSIPDLMAWLVANGNNATKSVAEVPVLWI